MTVEVISGIPASQPQPTRRLTLRFTDEDLWRLDECAAAAKTDRTNLLRRLIKLAYQDLIICREFEMDVAEMDAKRTNGHEAKETG